MTLPPYIVVFDVESIGLLGEGFAVGAVVVDTAEGKERASLLVATDPRSAQGTDADREWIEEHVPHRTFGEEDFEITRIYHAPSTMIVRDKFMVFWLHWRDRGALLAADVPFPVETNFLTAAVRDQPARQTPYPLIDVASVLLAAGMDPLATYGRNDDETPAHHPTADARQSARLLLHALDRIRHGESDV